MDQKKILLVEDDQFLRTLYDDLLKTEGLSVEQAVDGEEAYNKIIVGGWDLILLDIMLPKMDGIQVINKLKAENPNSLQQKIILLTNLDKDALVKEVGQTGFKYLIKSDFNPEEFVNKVKELLR